MKQLKTIFLVLSAALALSCDKGIHGRVTCEGAGLGNVVVSDGYDCVLTKANGRFRLESRPDARFLTVSTPAGYLPETEEKTVPIHFKKITKDMRRYDFELKKNEVSDNHHLFIVQADPQVNDTSQFSLYGEIADDIIEEIAGIRDSLDIFGLECGDIVWDTPHLYEPYKKCVSKLDMPIYRAIGNHDMTYGGRSFETSYSRFEEEFGPIYYSFNRGKAHYVILDNCFYIDRDLLYIGYLDERTLSWMEKDLSFVPEDALLFIVMHIPASYTKEILFNKPNMDELANCQGLFNLIRPWKTHLITGHTHFNHNVCFSDSLMEHNTAASCGTWWLNRLCTDGTPRGYGIYDVKGTEVAWRYKGAGYPADYQFRCYPVGADPRNPEDFVVNVWNYDQEWTVEWRQRDDLFQPMIQFTGSDPEIAEAIESDLGHTYPWMKPAATDHLFKARPQGHDPIEILVTDRFGNRYQGTYQCRKQN